MREEKVKTDTAPAETVGASHETRQKALVEVSHVSYAYPAYEGEESKLALDDFSLSVQEGEFIAILGHNGSGKSTLARLINAQDVPLKGEIHVLGHSTADASKSWEIRSGCGMVFQNPDNQMVASVVEEEVAFGPENLGIPNPELRERVDRALEAVGMADYRRRMTAELSGGQKQRVAIAGILAMRPSCLILDEPTAMLDPMGRAEIMDVLEKLRGEGMTLLLITHYMEEAVHADRVIVMNDGRMAMEGRPAEIFSQVEKMRSYQLDVPQMTELAYRLRQEGFDLPPDILSIDQMVEALS